MFLGVKIIFFSKIKSAEGLCLVKYLAEDALGGVKVASCKMGFIGTKDGYFATETALLTTKATSCNTYRLLITLFLSSRENSRFLHPKKAE